MCIKCEACVFVTIYATTHVFLKFLINCGEMRQAVSF